MSSSRTCKKSREELDASCSDSTVIIDTNIKPCASLDEVASTLSDEYVFKCGVDFAQSVYRKLHMMSGFELSEIFKVDGGSLWAVIQKYSVQQIDSMIRNFKLDVVAGDKFLTASKGTIVVTCVDEETDIYYYILSNGKTGSIKGSDAFIKKICKRCPRNNSNDSYQSAVNMMFGKEGD